MRRAVEIAIRVMRKFWREPPENHEFPFLEDWFRDFQKAEKINFAPAYIEKARKYFAELNAAIAPKTLLARRFSSRKYFVSRARTVSGD